MASSWVLGALVALVLVVALVQLVRSHLRAARATEELNREIKVCHVCWRSWSLRQWPRLELVGVPELAVEARRCECGAVLEVDVEAVARRTVVLRETGLP